MLYFGLIVLSFLALLGLYYLVRGLVIALSKPRTERGIIVIEPVCCAESAEFELRKAAAKVMWLGRFAPDRIVVPDCNMDGETRRVCELVCRDYPFIELCTGEELLERILGLSKQNSVKTITS